MASSNVSMSTSNIASSNVHVHITEHVTSASAVLSTATLVTSSFPHTSVIFSPQPQPKNGPRLRSSAGSQVKSTHMRLKVSPDKTIIATTKPPISATQDIVLSRPKHEKKLPIPQVPISTSSNLSSDMVLEPNIINLHNVENIDEWLRSSKNVYVGRESENDALKNEECKWGNPFRLQEYKSREKVVELYRAHVLKNEEMLAGIEDLHGKVLGCWCSPCRCHAEVLHELAKNSPIYEDETSSTNIHASSPTFSTTTTTTTTTTTCSSSSSNTEGETSSTNFHVSPTFSSSSSNTEGETSTYVHASSLTPSSSSSPTGDSLTPPLTAFDLKSLAERLNGVEGQVIFQKKHIDLQENKIKQLEERISCLEGDLIQTKARFCVRDSVIEALRGEVHRLQQYTRRYSVTVSGIDKGKDENHENPKVLHEKVLQLVTDVNSTTTEQDIDKFHRNGRLTNGKDQEIIIRFKSHSAKEAFYKARKNLVPARNVVKIRPSLSLNQINLLRDAKSAVEDFSLDEELVNPVEFVFANIHGLIQAKLKRKFRGSPFVSFNSIPEFVRKVQEAQVLKDAESAFDEVSTWADKSSRRKSVRQSRPAASNDDDDMGFGLFD